MALARAQHLDAHAEHHGRAAAAALRRLEAGQALEVQGHVVVASAQHESQRSGVGRQHRARHAQARGVGAHEIGIARFVVLRIGAQHGGRRQDHLAGQAVAQARAGHRQLAAARPGTVAHRQRLRAGALASGGAVELHAEGARQQRIGRRHQRVGARGQARHAGADGDLLAHERIDRALLRTRGRHGRLHAGHDGIHRVGREPRQREAAVGADLHQRAEARVGRAAAPAHEARAREVAAAGQVERRALLALHAGPHEAETDGQVAVETIARAHAGERDLLAVVQIVDAVHRAAIGHAEALAAHGRDAARQQPGLRGERVAQRQVPERRAHHAALLDDVGAHRQVAEGRVRHGRRRAGALDAQPGVGPVLAVPAHARGHQRHHARGRVDLRGAQGQAAGHDQAGGGADIEPALQETQVAGAVQRDLAEGRQIEHGRFALAVEHGDLAGNAEAHAVANIDQVARQRQAGAGRHARHAARGGGCPQHFARERSHRPGQPHIRAGQRHLRVVGGALAQREATGVDLQALTHAQVEAVFERERGAAEQREVVEAAAAHRVGAQARLAVFECAVVHAGPQGVGRQGRALLVAEHQHAMPAHPVFRLLQRVQVQAQARRVERHAQRAAGRALAARECAQRAVQVQPVVRRERDAAAVAGHVGGAHAGHVEHRVRARCIEQRARPHDDEVLRRGRHAARRVDLAADQDAAAVAHQAVALAVDVGGGGRARRDVEHRLLADPDRARMGLRVGLVGLEVAEVHRLQHDAPGAGAQGAFDRELAGAAHLDGLTGVDVDGSPLAHHGLHRLQLRGLRGRGAGLQRQARALALRENGLGGVFLVERRRPRFQRIGRLAAGGDVLRVRAEAEHRHRHVDLRAIGHGEAVVADERIAAEALVEEIRAEHQHVGEHRARGVADGDAVGLHRERAAAVHPVAAQCRAVEHDVAVAAVEAIGLDRPHHQNLRRQRPCRPAALPWPRAPRRKTHRPGCRCPAPRRPCCAPTRCRRCDTPGRPRRAGSSARWPRGRWCRAWRRPRAPPSHGRRPAA